MFLLPIILGIVCQVALGSWSGPELPGAISNQTTDLSKVGASTGQLSQQPTDFAAEGKRLLEQQDWAGAEAAFRKALLINRQDAKTQNNLGNALAQQGKLVEAIAAFRQATQLDPSLSAAYYNLGYALAQQKDLDASVVAFQQAAKLSPRDADTHYFLGVVLGQQGRYGEAIAAYRRTIELDPDYAEAYGNLGLALAETGRIQEASAALTNARDYFNRQGRSQDAARAEQYLQRIQSQLSE
ncbi:MAG TPA: tetratricopeptide repeat protein [Leptolyngbyaceae cyanobacterium M33_DOE_097]|uniref:Tetratricopeptide repeat protein n=1 Tax=Oscillatoriales cyanobacterium SpSt-418 TaxID=2282169 RepID=A0A7C3PER4_9CYAN|nr:tetratricopeptide repeat protein [Leptolyngbyaceae cyanobacterium M33_DOE_097]